MSNLNHRRSSIDDRPLDFQLIEASPNSFQLFNELQILMQESVTRYLLRGYYLDFRDAPSAFFVDIPITRPDRLLARSTVPRVFWCQDQGCRMVLWQGEWKYCASCWQRREFATRGTAGHV